MNFNFFSYDDFLKVVSMKDAIAALRDAFGNYDPNQTIVPQRQLHCWNKDQEYGVVMPCYSSSFGFGVKLGTIMPDNPEKYGLDLIHSVFCGFCPKTGLLKAVIDGCALTNIRTGAICGLSVDLLTDRIPKSIAIIGAGTQANFFYQAVQCVREIDEINIYSRSPSSSQKFKNNLIEKHNFCGGIKICDSISEAVKDRDIIGTMTSTSNSEGFIKFQDLTKKTLICAIGGRTNDACEVDPKTLRNFTVVVDSIEASMTESAEIKRAIKERYISQDKINILKDVINLSKKNLSQLKNNKYLYFRSVGTALQDLAIARLLMC